MFFFNDYIWLAKNQDNSKHLKKSDKIIIEGRNFITIHIMSESTMNVIEKNDMLINYPIKYN